MILEKIKKVLTKPAEFFTEVKSEVGIGNAFKYLAIISLVYVVLMMIFMFIFSLVLGASYRSLIGYGLFPFSLFAGIFVFALPIAIYLISLLGSFVGAGVIHLFAKMFGGKGDYSATYKASVYSSTPSLLFGWIPYLNILVGIYSLYLYLKGLSILHEISMGRAFLIAILPGIIVAIVILAFVFIFLFGVYVPTGYFYRTTTTVPPYEYTIPTTVVKQEGLTSYVWLIISKLPFYPKM